jgi:iron complex transport system permease protein
MITGPRFDALLPVAFLLGAGYLLAVDDVVRMLEVEVPLGILTALIGAPFFAYLLTRVRRSWT